MTDLSDDEIHDNVSAFEAAAHARHFEIVRPQLSGVLVALDGSNQSSTAEALAKSIADRMKVPVRSMELSRQDRPEVRLLEALGSQRDTLLVLPVPFQEDFTALGRDSAGAVLDLLLARRSGPLLAVRDPLENPERCFDHMTIPLTLVKEGQERAVGWAFALTNEKDGVLHLLATIDEEWLETYRGLGGPNSTPIELDERMLSGVGHPRLAGIISAAQKEAAHRGVDCRVSVREGDVITEITRFSNESPSIIVTPCPQPCFSLGSLRVSALIRKACFPVLVL